MAPAIGAQQIAPPQAVASTRVGARVHRPGNWTYRGLRRRWHVALALVIAAAMVAAAVITAQSLSASASTNFPGVLASTSPEYFNFVNQGQLTSVDVVPGEQVIPGQILATQLNATEAAAVVKDNIVLASDPQALAALLGASGQTAAAQATLLLDKAQHLSTAEEQRGASLVAQGAAQVSAAEAQLTAANAQLATDEATYQSKCPGGTGKSCPTLSRDISLDNAAIARAGTRVSDAQASYARDQGLNTTLSALAAQVQQTAVGASATLAPSLITQIRLAREAVAEDSYQQVADNSALAGTELVAPIGGIVVGVFGEPGEIVGSAGSREGSTNQSSVVPTAGSSATETPVPSSPSNSSAASQPFISIDAAGIEAVAQVPEAQIPAIFVGENAKVTVNALSGKAATLSGKVSSVVLQPVVVGGAVFYNVTVVAASGSWSSKLLSGMTANVAIP
jgi:hypothetical protein